MSVVKTQMATITCDICGCADRREVDSLTAPDRIFEWGYLEYTSRHTIAYRDGSTFAPFRADICPRCDKTLSSLVELMVAGKLEIAFPEKAREPKR